MFQNLILRRLKLTEHPIKGNGTREVKLDMGMLNCVGEPYVLDINGTKIILRYKSGNPETDFGTITLEALADDA